MIARVIVAALLILASFSAFAQSDALLTWTNATTNIDGSPIPISGEGALTRTTVEYGSCSSTNVFGTKQGEIFVVPPLASATVHMVVVQMFCFRAFHTNSYGVPSAFSNVVSKRNAPIPMPPTTLTVVQNLTAYTVTQSRDQFGFVAVGTVAPGTECDMTQPVRDKYVVPRESVTFLGNVEPELVVASCS